MSIQHRIDSYKIILYFLSVYGKYPSYKEKFYFQNYIKNHSHEEVFTEMILKLEFKKNIALNLSKEEITAYFHAIDGRSENKIIHNTLKSFDTIKQNSELNYIKKLWEDMYDCCVHRYNNEDCRRMIEEHFDERILKAYDKLIPGAFKSDIWRLCALYLHGGVYSDVHIRPHLKYEPSSFLDSADYVFCIDKPSSNEYIYNAFMKTPKASKLIKIILDEIISNVEQEYVPERDLEVSGPGVHGKVISNYLNISEFKEGFIERNGELFLFLTHQKLSKANKHEYCISLDNTTILLCRYAGYRDELQKICDSEHYSTLFEKGEIYRTSE